MSFSAKGAKGDLPGYPTFQDMHVRKSFKAGYIPWYIRNLLFRYMVNSADRMAQKELAEYMGVQKENALLVNSGDVVSLDEDSCQVTDHVACGSILVDGLGVGDVGNIVLRDRQNLAQNGIIVVVLTLEKHSNQLLSGPDIVSRGFVYVRESEDLLEEAHSVVADAVADCLDRHVSDWGKIKNIIKDSLSDFLWKRMKRNPMILPIIMEV